MTRVLIFVLLAATVVWAGGPRLLENVRKLHVEGETPLAVRLRQQMEKDQRRAEKRSKKGTPCFEMTENAQDADAVVTLKEDITSAKHEGLAGGTDTKITAAYTVRDREGRVLLEGTTDATNYTTLMLQDELYKAAGCNILGQRKQAK